jgi:uncharacterized protein YaiI (UPF0178 family)
MACPVKAVIWTMARTSKLKIVTDTNSSTMVNPFLERNFPFMAGEW